MAATFSAASRLLPSGDSAIAVEFTRNIDDAANRRVLALDRAIAGEPIPGVTETVPTYRSLLVHYDPVQIDFGALGEKLLALAERRCRRRQKPGAGAFPWSMAANMASISRTSRRRSTPRPTTLWRGMSRATTASP